MSVSLDTLLVRARDLVPALTERAVAAETLRALPPETIADLTAADIWPALTPTEHGGLGLDIRAAQQVGRTLAAGCTSTGWVSAFFMTHCWLLAHFPIECQREVLGDGNYALMPAALSPTITATVNGDGYELSGRVGWGTGSAHASWVMVTAIVTDRDDIVDLRMVVVPAAEISIEDVWHTQGMRATSSNDIVVEGVTVPRNRSISMLELTAGESPGLADLEAIGTDTRTYRCSFVPFLASVAAAPALGAAERALELATTHLEQRVLAYTAGVRSRDRGAALAGLGRGRASLRAAAARYETTAEAVRTGPAAAELDPVTRRSTGSGSSSGWGTSWPTPPSPTGGMSSWSR